MVMRYLILILALLCASCGSSLPTIKPYKMDIQQGNVVTSKMLLQLRPGMTKSQVRFIMGTPLIQDTFHANRWDYFYQLRKNGKIVDQRRVILDFENEALARVRGDVVAAGSGEPVTEPVTGSDYDKKSATPGEDKKSLLDKLKFWKSDEKKVEKTQEVPSELVEPKAKQPAASKQQAPAKQQASQPSGEEATKPEPVVAPKSPAEPEAPQAAPIKTEESAPAPEPKAEPVAQPAAAPEPQKAVAAPAPTPVSKPAPTAKPQAASQPASKPAPAAEPENDLPPEDEPGYFERMLEKIGF
ncbi:MAG TPA: outer membrane protein assembly factor BamE [Methylophilaceae bacterium]|jgi:outer membrane protein assembly factor BamE